MKRDKKYTLKIPRAQYNRLGRAFTLDDTYFDKLLVDTDEIIFHVSESQRKSFANYAKKNDNHKYWICQMFLPRNITEWEIEDGVVNN
jgi:hypothetical protein